MFRKPSFIGTQKSHNAISKTKYRKQNKIIIIIIIYKRQKLLQVLPSLGTKKKTKTKQNKTKKGGLYNTYLELLSKKWIVKRSRFHVSYIISPQSVAIFTTSHLMGCIEYQYNSLEDKVYKSAVATSYQLGWIDYTRQNILVQKF